MPLFDYECTECGRRVEDVLCKHDDPPPAVEEPCPAPTMLGKPCELERVLSTAGQSHRFTASDGVDGWVRQPSGVMVRTHRGGSGDKYGDSVR